MSTNELLESLTKWGKYIGFLTALAGLLSLFADARIVSLILLLVGWFLISLWLVGILREKSSQSKILLPDNIKSPAQRKRKIYAGFSLVVITIIFWGATIRVSSPHIGDIEDSSTPSQTLTLEPTATLTVTPTLTFTPTSTSTPTLEPSPTATRTPTATFTLTPTKIKTSTLPPTATKTFTSTPNPIIYRGLDRNCVDSNYWDWNVYSREPTPESFSNGCWNLITRGISAQDKTLRINIANPKYPLFSLSTNLPEGDLEIHFKVEIEAFSSKMSSSAAVLVFGIGGFDDKWQQNGNYIMYSILQHSNDNQVYEDVGKSKVERYPGIRPLVMFLPSRTFDIVILIKGIELTVIPDKKEYFYYPAGLKESSDRDRFWIGYQLPTNSSLKATISEFYIIQK